MVERNAKPRLKSDIENELRIEKTSGITPSETLAAGFMSITQFLDRDHMADVVDGSLHWLKFAANSEKEQFKRELDSSSLPRRLRRMKMLNPSSYDKRKPLSDGLIRQIGKCDHVTSAVLNRWVRHEEALRKFVDLELEKTDESNAGQLLADGFTGTWDVDDLESHVENIVHREGSYSRNDVFLMLCLSSGKIPERSNETADADESPSEVLEQIVNDGSDEHETHGQNIQDVQASVTRSPTVFPNWLEHLQQLPPDAPEWQEAREFIAQFEGIRQAKEREAVQANAHALGEALVRLRSDFPNDLRYLELDISVWSTVDFFCLTDISESRQSIERLYTSLREYSAVRVQAPTRSEEDERRIQRSDCERRILSLVDKIDHLLMPGDNDPDNGTSLPDEKSDDRPDCDREIDSGDLANKFESREAKNDRRHIEGFVREENDDRNELVEKRAKVTELERRHHKLVEDNRKLELRLESVARENNNLVSELHVERRCNESLRLSLVSERQGPSDEGDHFDPTGDEFAKVSEAVRYAKETFSGELVMAPNSKSEKNPVFEDAPSVWKALMWLATYYYKVRRGSLAGGKFDSTRGFDRSCREACGFQYKPKQSDKVKGKYPDYYRTDNNGETFELDEHIGRGSGDPRSMIRIGFAWDKQREKVVIGYIGRHPRTDAS